MGILFSIFPIHCPAVLRDASTAGQHSRRYEWKCVALNAASRRAALRRGMTYEGVFRQATIYKKRNRDTAWFSILDHEWPRMKIAFESWLRPENFTANGQQICRLSDLKP